MSSLEDVADRAEWPEPNFNDPFEVAAHCEVPEEGEWEYHVRKGANDGKGDAVRGRGGSPAPSLTAYVDRAAPTPAPPRPSTRQPRSRRPARPRARPPRPRASGPVRSHGAR